MKFRDRKKPYLIRGDFSLNVGNYVGGPDSCHFINTSEVLLEKLINTGLKTCPFSWEKDRDKGK